MQTIQTQLSKYEITIIYSTREDDFQESRKKIEGLFKELGVKIDSEQDLGNKEFAYPILKNTHGHYYVYKVSAPGSVIKTFAKEVRLMEKILRHLVIHLDKKALRYFDKVEEKEKQKEKEKKNLDQRP